MAFPQSVPNIVAKSAAYTANPGETVVVTAASSSFEVTLPAIGNLGVSAGPVTVFKIDAGSGVVTVATSDGSKVNGGTGSTGLAINATTAIGGHTFATDGSNWFTVG